VAPGISETDMMKAVPKEVIEPMIKQSLCAALGQPEDIANALCCSWHLTKHPISQGRVLLSVDGMART
jgi:3-oxoacyl-[acyl-carrier protein] reductase/7-alpha-hydroxysteroid dehydrogenase